MRISSTREVWGGDHGAAALGFDDEGHVVSKDWYRVRENYLHMVRDWLHL